MKKVYSKIESITGSVITVRADGIRYGDLAEVDTVFGTSLAEVNRLENDLVSLQVFAGGRGGGAFCMQWTADVGLSGYFGF